MKVRSSLATFYYAMVVQARLSYRDWSLLTPLVTTPLQSIIAMAILIHGGRSDLAAYSITAAFLFTIGYTSVIASSEAISVDRRLHILEHISIVPVPYSTIIASRSLMGCLVSSLGLVESWIIVRFCFGLEIQLRDPILLFLIVWATIFSAVGMSLLTAALFSLGRTNRTFELTLLGPLYLIGGVLAPVQYLPHWLQILSPLTYLYWSAELVRGALGLRSSIDVGTGIILLVVLGAINSTLGAIILSRMMNTLRASGRLALT